MLQCEARTELRVCLVPFFQLKFGLNGNSVGAQGVSVLCVVLVHFRHLTLAIESEVLHQSLFCFLVE